MATRTFRIFVSSTFSDLVEERRCLVDRVFPRLREFCHQHGTRFQGVDLRWGVSNEAALNQTTMSICLGEIARSQAASPRPNFILLLGERYGWRPLPSAIALDELAAITRRCAPAARLLFEEWYRRDDNAVEPEGVLRTRANPFQDDARWAEVERAMLEELIAFDSEKYGASATELEIRRGILGVPDSEQHAFCYFRTIEGLPEGTGSYVEADADARRRLTTLKATLEARLQGHVRRYAPRWTGRGVSGEHIDQLCEDVYADLSGVIRSEIERAESAPEVEKERAVHVALGSALTRQFVGRGAVVESLGQYLAGTDRHPLVLYGVSGSGKSTVVARAAQLATPGAVVVERYVGSTPRSSNGRALLSSLWEELSACCGDATPAPVDYNELLLDFAGRLALAKPDRPLVVLIDGVDQLSENDPARALAWLPVPLPKHVKVVVSILSDGPPRLERLAQPGALVQLEPMPVGEADELLDRWFADAGRTLQPPQRRELMSRFAGVPLYLRLVFEQARRWPSFRPSGAALSSDVSVVVRSFFHELALDHGALLIERSLALLAAARAGLSEDELLDLLSRDADVVAEFAARSPRSPDLGKEARLPVVAWSRLHTDLEPYLREVATEGATVLAYYHRQLAVVAREAFLSSNEQRRRTHGALAAYFGAAGGEAPPVEGGGPALRRLHELPYQLTLAERFDELRATLTDLVFLEQKATHIEAVEVVDSRGLSRTVHNGVFHLQDDFERALAVWPVGGPGVGPVARQAFADCLTFLRQELETLQIAPRLLPQQARNFARESAVTLAAAASPTPRAPWVRLANPPAHVTPLRLTLGGHEGPIAIVQFAGRKTTRLVTVGDDGLLRVLDPERGLERWRVRLHESLVGGRDRLTWHAWGVVGSSATGELLIVCRPNGLLRVLGLDSGDPLFTANYDAKSETIGAFSSPDDSRIVTITAEGTVRLWDRAGRLRSEAHLPEPVYQCIPRESENAFLSLSKTQWGSVGRVWRYDGDSVTVDGTRDRELPDWLTPETALELQLRGVKVMESVGRVVHYWEGEQRRELFVDDPLITGTGLLCAERGWVLLRSWGGRVHIWDRATGEARGDLRGHGYPGSASSDGVDLAVSADGRWAATAGPDGDVRVWDLDLVSKEDGDTDVRDAAFMPGGRDVVTVGDRTSIWSVASGAPACHGPLESRTRVVVADRWIFTSSNQVVPDLRPVDSPFQAAPLPLGAPTVPGLLSASGDRLAHGSWGGAVVVVDLASNDPALICELIVGRPRKIADPTPAEYYRVGRGDVSALRLADEGSALFAAVTSQGSCLELWSCEKDRAVRCGVLRVNVRTTSTVTQDSVVQIEVSPDLHRLIAGLNNGTVAAWDLATGRRLFQRDATIDSGGHFGRSVAVTAVAVSADGKRFAWGGFDGLVYIETNGNVSTASSFRLGYYRNIDVAVKAIAFLEGDRFLAFANRSGDVNLIDLETGERVGEYPLRTAIETFAISGSHVAVADGDRRLHLLALENLPPGLPLAVARKRRAGFALRCPRCRAPQPVRQLGVEVECSTCHGRFRVGPRPLRHLEPSWWRRLFS